MSPDDSDGALLELEAWYPGGWCEPAVHHHPHQEERGTVLDGCLLVSIAGRTRTYHPGARLDDIVSRRPVPTSA